MRHPWRHSGTPQQNCGNPTIGNCDPCANSGFMVCSPGWKSQGRTLSAIILPLRPPRRSHELTVFNFYTHSIAGTVLPRLPAGWTATASAEAYHVAAGALDRFELHVSIPQGAAHGAYQVGGQTTYDGHNIKEVFTQKVLVK